MLNDAIHQKNLLGLVTGKRGDMGWDSPYAYQALGLVPMDEAEYSSPVLASLCYMRIYGQMDLFVSDEGE